MAGCRADLPGRGAQPLWTGGQIAAQVEGATARERQALAQYQGAIQNAFREVRDAIRRLGMKKTILLSTHILQEVEAIASRALFINEGRLIYDGSVAELTKDGGTLAERLGVTDLVDVPVPVDPLRLADGLAGHGVVAGSPGGAGMSSTGRLSMAAKVWSGAMITPLPPPSGSPATADLKVIARDRRSASRTAARESP